ncbi:hypothetical protein OG594_46690 [Streptomyces sp. NBC_01214]|nr:hypothetical protein [Streptomyces sp. NBC_01214]MCX4804760.1 hypothetical protein [Streptomyces sp. NBC_01214]MCX4808873.1 hypothetical protein [Streptomyces sp. NBC_01214]MCX4808944.1 hypothetical protein [Streptomyces sp. NBC_01214]
MITALLQRPLEFAHSPGPEDGFSGSDFRWVSQNLVALVAGCGAVSG